MRHTSGSRSSSTPTVPFATTSRRTSGACTSPCSKGARPTFRVASIDSVVEKLAAGGLEPLRPIFDLGEGKRVASFVDPDGNTFNVIELPA